MRKTLILIHLTILFRISLTTHPILCNYIKSSFKCDFDSNNTISKLNYTPKQFKIVEYNIDFNGFGGDSPYEKGFNQTIDVLQMEYKDLDILMVSEIARDCKDYGNYINAPLILAEKLKLNYAYFPEYTKYKNRKEFKLRKFKNLLNLPHQCTFGNAIFSKYEILDIQSFMFNTQCCSFPLRYGGRSFIAGKIRINKFNYIQLYSTHLESGDTIEHQITALSTRRSQMKQILKHYKNENYKHIKKFWKTLKAIIAGDMNSPNSNILSAKALAEKYGFIDTHKNLHSYQRKTIEFGKAEEFGIKTLDYILVKNLRFFHSRVCFKKKRPSCIGTSDHNPISTIVLT